MKYNVHVIPPINKSKKLCTYLNIKPVKPKQKQKKNTRYFFKYKLDYITYNLNLHINDVMTSIRLSCKLIRKHCKQIQNMNNKKSNKVF